MTEHTREKTINNTWILSVLVVLTILFNADYTAVNLALVTISRDFHVSISYIQWALSAYVLVWAMLSIPGGKLADYLGHVETILLGSGIVAIACVLAGVATSAWFLIACRVLQGMGAAFCFPGLYGIVTERLPQERQQMAFGIMASSAAAGLIIGPTISGLLIHFLNWRFIFFINVPLILFAYYILLTKVPRKQKAHGSLKLDYKNLLLFMLSMFGVTLWLNQVLNWGVISLYTLYALGGSALLLGVFLILQGKKKEPIIRFSLYKITPYLGSTLLYCISMYGFVFCLLIFAIYLQNVKTYSAYDAGFIYFFFSGVLGIVSLITPKLLKHFSVAKVIFYGELLTIVGYASVLLLNQTTGLWIIQVPLVIMAIGLGLAFPAFNTEMAISLPQELIGEGSGLFITFGLLFSSIFAVLTATLLNGWLHARFYLTLAKHSIHLTSAQHMSVNAMLAHAHITMKGLLAVGFNTPHLYLQIFYQSFMYAMHNLAVIGMFLGLIASLIAVFTLRTKSAAEKV